MKAAPDADSDIACHTWARPENEHLELALFCDVLRGDAVILEYDRRKRLVSRIMRYETLAVI